MTKIAPFAVERWMDDWETRCELNLAETCVHSLSVAEMMTLVGRDPSDLAALWDQPLTYGPIRGSDRLRGAIAALYEGVTPERVIVTHGTIGANMLVHRALVEPGDRVVSLVPTYQQHVSIPESLGADVRRLALREADGWLPDLDALRALVTPGTRLIALTNPNNPTGALIPAPMLHEIAAIARAAGAWVLCDEVYRGLDQVGQGTSPSIAEVYERGISTAGMSKAFSLAGLRLGWVAGPDSVIEAVAHHRDYDTISVGRVDDALAAMALEGAVAILARARRITRTNLARLAEWVSAEDRVEWVRPASGTTTLIRYGLDMPSRDFCLALVRETGVMLTPGDAFGTEGYARIGFANPSQAMAEGLARLSGFLAAR